MGILKMITGYIVTDEEIWGWWVFWMMWMTIGVNGWSSLRVMQCILGDAWDAPIVQNFFQTFARTRPDNVNYWRSLLEKVENSQFLVMMMKYTPHLSRSGQIQLSKLEKYILWGAPIVQYVHQTRPDNVNYSRKESMKN